MPSDNVDPAAGSFRDQILQRMLAAFDEPEVSTVESDHTYRWTLRRSHDLSMYVTMDGPEHASLAHIIVSDGVKYQDRPIISTVIHTLDEGDALIARLAKQWKCAANRR